MGARQSIPIQTRAITVSTADGADVTRDCIVWHSKRAGYRAMYVDEVAMDVCEVSLTDATDPECCTSKKDGGTCVPVSMLHKRELLATLRAHEASMPHLSAVCERVQAAVDSRDASKAPEPTARSPSLEALMRSLQRDADGRICMEFPVPEGPTTVPSACRKYPHIIRPVGLAYSTASKCIPPRASNDMQASTWPFYQG